MRQHNIIVLEEKVAKKVIKFLKIYDVVEQCNLLEIYILVYVDKKTYMIEEIALKTHYNSRTIQRYIKKINKIIEEIRKNF